MICNACSKELKEDETILEVACTYTYCMDCVRVMMVSSKIALDAA